MPWSPTVLAYFAGLFDGEGTVDVRVNSRPDRRTPEMTMRIAVYNTDLRAVQWLVGNFGGTVTTCHRERCRALYQWRMSLRNAEPLLRAAREYMVIKVEQVDAAFEMLTLIGGPGHKVVNFPERVALANRISALKKGVADAG